MKIKCPYKELRFTIEPGAELILMMASGKRESGPCAKEREQRDKRTKVQSTTYKWWKNKEWCLQVH